jgi:opacity protein-like surface antigen
MNARTAWSVLVAGIVWSYSLTGPAQAEYYVAGQVGVNFADRLKNIEGTGSLLNLQAPDFDLKNSVSYGAKLGYFPGNGPTGVELDVFNSQPNIKNLDDVPGIHLGVTNVGVNLLLRYPGQTFQPYVGIGGALLIARLSESATTRSDTDVGFGFNVLGGVRAFITPYVAIFTEYKFTNGTLTFDDAFGPVGGFSGDYQVQNVMVGVSYHF